MSMPEDHKDDKEKAEREVPIVEEDFAKLLQKFKIKPELAANIAENISLTGGPTVFEDPAILTNRLQAWSGDISPARRKLILEQWCAEKGIVIPQDVLQQAGKTVEEIKKDEKEKTADDKVKYRYDPDSGQVVMAKPGEGGGTLSEAKALKKMAEEGEAGGKESPFTYNSEGKLILNPKARIGGVEILAYDAISKAQASGGPVDPIQAMADAAAKMETLRNVFGISPGGGTDWMNDPLKFMERVRAVSGGDSGSKALADQVQALTQRVNELKEEKYQNQITQQQGQINALTQRVNELVEIANDPNRRPGAKSEMDIIYEVVHGGMDEIKGLRTDVKTFLTGHNIPPAKTPGQREDRKNRMRQGIESDQELEQLGSKIFFP